MSETANRISSFAGLQVRLLLIIFMGATLFSVAAGTLAYHLGQERAVANSRATLMGLAQAVEKTIAIGAFAADPVLVREVVDGLARNPLVAMAQVRLTNGEVLAQNPDVEMSGLNTTVLAGQIHIDQFLFSPFDEVEQVGVLRILANAEHVAKTAKQEAKTLAAMMVGQAVLMAILLYGVLALLVSNPITRLARRLRAMPPGTSERLDTPQRHRGDEIGTLIGGANALLDSNAVALNRERELRAEIEKMEAQYRQIFDSSSAGIFVLDEKGWLINSNPTVSKVLGMSLSTLHDLTHDNFIERVFGQPDQVRAMIQKSARTEETVSADIELIQQGNTRRWVHCLISVHKASDQTEPAAATTTEGVMYDITERKSAETAVRYQAEHDALTGLKNRAASHATLDSLLEECEANASPLSVMCIDLDGFKQINDQHGHDAGDQVLMACAQRMNIAVRRSTDLVGRLGGDEFIVVLRNIGPADAALNATAQAILVGIRAPITIRDGTQVNVGASIGIACAPLHDIDRINLLEMADISMYEVKRTGKNTYAMAVPKRP